MTTAMFTAFIIFGIIAFFLLLSLISNQRRLRKIKKRLAYYYGRWRELDYSDETIASIGEYTSSKERMIDDITWNDLDMDSLFLSINHTWSFAGEDYLYYLLHVPKVDPKEWAEQEEMISYYQTHEKERIEMQLEFARVGKNHAASVYTYIQESIQLNAKTPLIHYLFLGLLIFSVGMIFIEPAKGVGILFICMAINICGYFYKRKGKERGMQALQYFTRLSKSAGRIIKKDLIYSEKYKERLAHNVKVLKKQMGGTAFFQPANMDSMSLTDAVMDYIRMITHIDSILFSRCMRRLQKEMDVVENLITTMGFLESMLTVGSLRKSLPYWCTPEFTEDKMLDIVDAYHPRLEEPVPNSVSVTGGILITGSNASGKSTFLKTVALNVILAQSLHTCAAKEYRGKWFHIFSSMALRDNLYNGESYYIAEIKALKRVMEQSDGDAPALCFVDEVLRGTNTVERIAASTQVLKRFYEKGILCFAATHDIELTYLLEDFYDNYHFQEQVVDGQVVFDYLLYKERSTSRNAIQLLKMLGYDEQITEGAGEMVETFMRTGKWSLDERNVEKCPQ